MSGSGMGGSFDINDSPQNAPAERAPDISPVEPMTLDAVERNPWNAVNMAVPEAPSDELLSAAREAAARCASEAYEELQWQPLSELEGIDQDYQAARARGDLLDEIARARELTPERPEFSAEEVMENPWSAVDKDIPFDASPDLLRFARDTAAGLVEIVTSELGGHPEAVFAVSEDKAVERIAQARARISELDTRLELSRTSDISAEPDPPGPTLSDGNLLPAGRMATRVSESLARTVELVLATVIGFFVAEPELTPQQAHDMARANAERAEVRAFEAAEREKAAALDWTNTEVNRNRSSIHAGEGDAPKVAETIYDLYPGLTRDISADGERERVRESGQGLERDIGDDAGRDFGGRSLKW